MDLLPAHSVHPARPCFCRESAELAVSRPAASDPFARRSLRQALRDWERSPRLGEHPLGQRPLVEDHRQAAGYRSTSVGRGVALRDLLLRAIESLAADEGPADRRAAILRGLYLEGRSPAYLADTLGIARSTYDHEHAAALDALADRLREWDEHGLPANVAAQMPTRPAAPAPFLAPPLPEQPVLGRQALLDICRQHLLGGERLLALAGLPGVGKTALAIALAHDPAVRQAYPDGVFWAGLGQSPDLAARLGAWAVGLGWSLTELGAYPALEDRARLLQGAIRARRMLLVLDDAWAPAEARALQLGGDGSAHLTTTRSPALAGELAGAAAVVLPELDAAAGRAVLAHFVPGVVMETPEAADRLVQAVGGLPLALVLMGRHLRKEGRLGLPRRMQSALQTLQQPSARMGLLESRPALEAQPSLPIDAPLTLRTVIALSDSALDEPSRRMLAALAVLPPKPNTFSEEAACAVSDGSPAHLDALLDAGLVEPFGAGRLALHPVVADYAASLADSSAAEQRLVAYLASLPGRCGDDLTLLGRDESNAFAALHIAERLGQPGDLVRLAHAWFDYFEAVGRLESARPHLVQAVEAARAAGSTQSVWQAMQDLARASLLLGKYDQAVQLASEGLGLARRARGANGARAACGFLKILGLACLSRGEFERARAFCEQGLAEAEAADLGAERAALLANLGSILAKQGHVDEATGRTGQALTQARALGDRRLEGSLLANLGVLAAQRGDLGQAEPLFLEALELAQARGARGTMASLLTNLGALAHDRGDEAAAEAHFHEALAIADDFGDPARQAHLLANLGRIAVARGVLDEADRLYRDGLALARRTGHRENLALLLINAGALARLRGCAGDARALLEEALAIARDLGHARFLSAAEVELAKLSSSEDPVR
jgi:tetratricopeptide (TPR) repeat protein